MFGLLDSLAYGAPYYLIFRSAGNDRTDNPSSGQAVALSPGSTTVVSYDPAGHPAGDGNYRGGFETIGFNALAKNVLTVGSVTTNGALTGANLGTVTGVTATGTTNVSTTAGNLTISENALDANPTFTTIQVNPSDDPIQRGCVWLQGGDGGPLAPEVVGDRPEEILGRRVRRPRVLPMPEDAMPARRGDGQLRPGARVRLEERVLVGDDVAHDLERARHERPRRRGPDLRALPVRLLPQRPPAGIRRQARERDQGLDSDQESETHRQISDLVTAAAEPGADREADID